MDESKVSKMIQRLFRKAVHVEPVEIPNPEPKRTKRGKLLTEELDDVTLHIESLIAERDLEPEHAGNGD